MGYPHRDIEEQAQKKWSQLGLYKTDLADTSKEKYYLLVEFPYPSGDLHIGHWYAFAVTDIYARLLRARGKNVLFPIGFDAFGLPAENAAIKNGADPKEWTYKNIERMRVQLSSMGPSFDWSKEVIACDPSYYQWTQWLFAKLFEHGLAVRKEAPVKWCPKDQTVLANEQVIDGKCDRCGTEVVEKKLTQWFFKITDYADRLLAGLDKLPWREEIKEAQRAWIGKSEGARLKFQIQTSDVQSIEVFTTRPDTVLGATYVVLAPEHEMVATLLASAPNAQEIRDYVSATEKKTERERSENKEKTGVEIKGVKAINPATQEEIPIYVADYVLGSYGTGAVMAVPAHDDRDMDFAVRHSLPIKFVIEPVCHQMTGTATFRPDEAIRDSHGVIALIKHWSEDKYIGLTWPSCNWVTLLTGGIDDGLSAEDTVLKEIREETGYINARIVKRLGVIHGKYYHAPKNLNRFGHGEAFYVELIDSERVEVDAGELKKHSVSWMTLDELRQKLTPATHPPVLDLALGKAYTGPGLLANSGDFSGRDSEETKWDITAAVGGKKVTQYRLRDWLVSRQRYWGCPIPIVYDPEGKPHAIPAEHLPWKLPTDVDFKPTGEAPLASSKELKDRVTAIFGDGWTPEYDTLDTFVDSSWYFLRYLAPKDATQFSDRALLEKWMPVDRYSGGSEHTTMHVLYARFFNHALYDLALVPTAEPFNERFNRGLIMGPDGQKMSKSKGNVVNPDEFVEKFGADAVRIYLAFIGPYNEPGSYPWNLDGVASMRKFLERVVRFVDNNQGKQGIEKMRGLIRKHLAITANKISVDGDRFKFNTCIAQLMTFLGMFEKEEVPQDLLHEFVIMLAPFAPHLAEHLWEKLGGEGSVHGASWPEYEPKMLESARAEVVVQVNGKRRGSLQLAVDATKEEALGEAIQISAVIAALKGLSPARVVYVPGKILNLVV